MTRRNSVARARQASRHGHAFAALALMLIAACAKAPERPNVLLITIDTLRSDRISAQGSERKTTPNLDALATEGLLFTHVQSPRAKTTPAIASLMTGLYPHDHGVRDLAMPLELRFPVLAEKFRAAGYATAAIVGNFVLKDALAGLSRGFDLWVEDLPDTQGVPPDDVPQRTARSLTDGALVALGLAPPTADAGLARPFVRSGKPWFLWLHYMDPHGLYDPPAEHRVFERATPDFVPDDSGPRAEGPHRFHVAEYNVPPSARDERGRIDAALVRDLYDGEVHYVDAQIGRLVAALRRQGWLDDTLVIVTADHGESLGEHEYWFEHGRDAYEVSCRVPLIARLPAHFERFSPTQRTPPAGRRAGDVSLTDLAPTLAELAHLPPFDVSGAHGPHGVSRAAIFFAEDRSPCAVFSEKVDRTTQSQAVQSKAVRIGDWKLIQRTALLADPNAPGRRRPTLLTEELYDLARDPGETRNRIATASGDLRASGGPTDGATLERLRTELARFLAADAHFAELDLALERRRTELQRTDAETLRIIEALGY